MNRNLRILSVVVFAIGLTIGLMFNIFSVWADFEASIFDSALSAGDSFPGMRCPIMISKDDIGVITGSAVNPLDRKMTLTIRSHSTDGAVTLLNETTEKLTLEIGESKEMEWTVAPDDAVWGNFILFRVYQFGSYPVPAKTSACGILLANISGLSGSTLIVFLIAFSLIGMGAGIWLWVRSNQPLKSRARDVIVIMTVLSVVIVVGFVFNFLGMWLPGVLVVVLSILLLIAILAFVLTSTNRRMVT